MLTAREAVSDRVTGLDAMAIVRQAGGGPPSGARAPRTRPAAARCCA